MSGGLKLCRSQNALLYADWTQIQNLGFTAFTHTTRPHRVSHEGLEMFDLIIGGDASSPCFVHTAEKCTSVVCHCLVLGVPLVESFVPPTSCTSVVTGR